MSNSERTLDGTSPVGCAGHDGPERAEKGCPSCSPYFLPLGTRQIKQIGNRGRWVLTSDEGGTRWSSRLISSPESYHSYSLRSEQGKQTSELVLHGEVCWPYLK